MSAGPKKHLKRLNAPKHWMLDKLSGIFVSCSRRGRSQRCAQQDAGGLQQHGQMAMAVTQHYTSSSHTGPIRLMLQSADGLLQEQPSFKACMAAIQPRAS